MTEVRPARGIVLPPYPYDRLRDVVAIAERHEGGAIDMSIGTPVDAPADDVLSALASSGTERGYPPSIGTPAFREAVCGWFRRRFGVAVDASQVGACIGTKELVVGIPHWLRLRDPGRDTVLYPEVSYPSYAMGATLAGCRAVPVPVDRRRALDLSAVDPADAARALCLWSNTPGNPAGGLDDLRAVAEWGRGNGVPVFSDECYVEFTWTGEPAVDGQHPGRTVLESGSDGVVAVHSLSKRSNLAGVRVGWYAGDADLVRYLQEIRKHAGLMVPGPAQAAAIAALSDHAAIDAQRVRYRSRLERMSAILARMGLDTPLPDGGFYLWVAAPDGDAWALADRLASELGVVGSPGEFYGEAAKDHLRLAMVQPDASFDLLESRLPAVGS